MNLSVHDTLVLTAGELLELTRRMGPITDATFTAMAVGEDVTPLEADACLAVTCRLATPSDAAEAHALLDRGLARLARAFPEQLAAA